MKFPLSIFNFSTLEVNFKELVSPTIIILMICFLIIELGLRFLMYEGQYPNGSWRNNELRNQAAQLDELKKVDVMFTGSSLASVNISPQAFDSILRDSAFTFTSFNAGIRGCDYDGINVVFDEIFWKRKKAKYIVLVISPWDLDEANDGVRARSATFINSVKRSKYEKLILDILSKSWLFGFRNEIRDFIRTGDWKYQPPLIGIRGQTPFGKTKNPVAASIVLNKFEVFISRNGETTKALFDLVERLIKHKKKIIIIEALERSDSKKNWELTKTELKKFYKIIKELDSIDTVEYVSTEDIIPEDKFFIDTGHISTSASVEYSQRLAKRFIELGLFK